MSLKLRLLLILNLLLTLSFIKRDDFTLPIVNFTFIGSDIPASSVYVVYISQLIRYCRACVQYRDFLDRVQLLQQGYVGPRLESFSQKLYGRHHNLGDRYEIAISQMTMELLLFTYMFSFFYHCQDFCRTWLYIWVTRWVSYKRQELFTVGGHPVCW